MRTLISHIRRQKSVQTEVGFNAADLRWDEEQADQAANVCFKYVESQIITKINWYRWKKRPLQQASKLVRLLAVALGVAGGICPLATLGTGSRDLERLGYILLASAGALLLFDRVFGLSSGWMRFMSAAQDLEAELDSLRIEWAILGANSEPEHAVGSRKLKLERLLATIGRVHSIIQRETNVWISEFERSLRDLQNGTLRTRQRSSDGGNLSRK